MASKDCDVLIVGAGPTGLSLACELLRHGVPVRIIDELPEPEIYSKAAVVHARTLEIFDAMGVSAGVLERAKILHGASVYAEGKRVAHLVFEGIDSPYPHVYGISQRDTELALASRFASLGGQIERPAHLDSFTQDGEGVRAHVIRPGGKEETIEASWLVGADGAHSVVRKQLGFTFEGSAYEEHLIQADLRVDWRHEDDDEILAFISPEGPLAFFPLFKDGRYRLIAIFKAGAPDVEPTLENFQRIVDERGPKGAKLSDPAWMVAFRIHCRRTNKYREGRVFIAGDAAHIHSPAGGQGMNTGIQDAHNLAWKLALVHRGMGKPILLDSYEAERLPIARSLLAGTDTATRGLESAVGLRHPIAVGLRNQLMSFVTSLDIVRAKLAAALSMTTLGYPESPIVAQDRTSVWQANVISSKQTEAPSLADWAAFGDGPGAGERACDAPIVLADGENRARLFELLRGTRHVLLLFDGAAATEEGYRNLEGIGARVRERFGDLISVRIVVPYAEKPAALRWEGSVILDEGGVMHRRYGARSECLYLVRPDGYVAYRNQPADATKLEAYLSKIFV